MINKGDKVHFPKGFPFRAESNDYEERPLGCAGVKIFEYVSGQDARFGGGYARLEDLVDAGLFERSGDGWGITTKAIAGNGKVMSRD